MSDEESFLSAIAESYEDESLRLVYADWLEERGEVDRAEYLRVEVELRRTWTWEDQQPGLVERMGAVRPRVDLDWLARVRRCTTPPPFVDVEALVPELRGRGRTAILLHPRPGETDVDASKIGGNFLWPANEPWPVCEEHDRRFVAAIQLRRHRTVQGRRRPVTGAVVRGGARAVLLRVASCLLAAPRGRSRVHQRSTEAFAGHH